MRVPLKVILFTCFLGYGLLYAQWYQYPSYQEYVGYMEKWQQDYPGLAKLYDLGPSGKGTHRIYAMRISDNVAQNEAEPRFIQTATLHDDEVLAYMITLHMIDTLLSSHGSDSRITDLVNNTELWFCPLCNPDFTYYGTDDRVSPPIRPVPGQWDLNRNWPCPCMKGNHKYYGLYSYYAPETAALMSLHAMYRFNLHTDMHGGTECVLWPYAGVIDKVCDEDWYKWVAKRYVGQVWSDCGNNGYMTSCGGDGMGNVFSDLYECHGQRMDFCVRFAQAKGVYLELSVRKNLQEADLEKHWRWNKEALFRYYELMNTGIQGIVTDASTKEPVFNVNVSAVGHDYDSAEVNTDSAGFYLRFIERGKYTFTFSHPDYYPVTTDSIWINDYNEKHEVNIELDRITEITSRLQKADQFISIHQTNNRIKIVFKERSAEYVNAGIYTVHGRLVHSFSIKAGEGVVGKIINIGLPGGCYFIRFEYRGNILSEKIVLTH
jgi:hypothetical protein